MNVGCPVGIREGWMLFLIVGVGSSLNVGLFVGTLEGSMDFLIVGGSFDAGFVGILIT